MRHLLPVLGLLLAANLSAQDGSRTVMLDLDERSTFHAVLAPVDPAQDGALRFSDHPSILAVGDCTDFDRLTCKRPKKAACVVLPSAKPTSFSSG